MKFTVFILGALFSTLSFAAGKEGVPFQFKEIFGNAISGSSVESKRPCQFNYRVDQYMSDRYANYQSLTSINTWFEDRPDLMVPIDEIPSKFFDDIFVSGNAFMPGYQLANEYANSFKFSIDAQTGAHRVLYAISAEVDGESYTKILDVELSSNLKPIRFSIALNKDSKSFLPRFFGKPLKLTCELDPATSTHPM